VGPEGAWGQCRSHGGDVKVRGGWGWTAVGEAPVEADGIDVHWP
jgi:hypothetical protein